MINNFCCRCSIKQKISNDYQFADKVARFESPRYKIISWYGHHPRQQHVLTCWDPIKQRFQCFHSVLAATAKAARSLALSQHSPLLLLFFLFLFLFLQTYTDPKMHILDHDQLRNMHAVLNLIVPALLNFVTVKFEGSSISPFETRPVTVFFSIFALLLYCSLSLPLAPHPPAFTTAYGARIFHLLMILSFSLSIALPTSLLFSGLYFWLLYLPLLIVLSAAPLWCLVQKLICLVQQKILAFIFIRLFCHRLIGGKAPPVLPRTVADAHFALKL